MVIKYNMITTITKYSLEKVIKYNYLITFLPKFGN